jgi:hypothetical protein
MRGYLFLLAMFNLLDQHFSRLTESIQASNRATKVAGSDRLGREDWRAHAPLMRKRVIKRGKPIRLAALSNKTEKIAEITVEY